MCLKDVAKVFGGGGDTPAVIQSSPIADQAKIDADARAKAGADSVQRRRRLRASSLLATGSGAGDTSSVVTGQATAKPTLGA